MKKGHDNYLVSPLRNDIVLQVLSEFNHCGAWGVFFDRLCSRTKTGFLSPFFLRGWFLSSAFHKFTTISGFIRKTSRGIIWRGTHALSVEGVESIPFWLLLVITRGARGVLLLTCTAWVSFLFNSIHSSTTPIGNLLQWTSNRSNSVLICIVLL